jgi:hypothetical protein
MRPVFVLVSLTALTTTALAQQQPPPSAPPPPAMPSMPAAPTMPSMPADPAADPSASMMPAPPPGESTDAPPPADAKKKEPKRGDFQAGGQVRLPSGPDEMGKYATFNWIAVDLKGTYYVFPTVTLTGTAPLAVKKPDQLMGGADPRMVGGMTVTLDAKLPQGPFAPKQYKSDVGLVLTGAYQREGAMLLSDKDFPLFVGDFQPGFAGGARVKMKMSSVIDFALTPSWVYQKGSVESLQAVQIPMTAIVKLGETLKVSADAGIFTGDDYSFRGKNGGRIAAGGAIDLKVGKIITHAGAGVASLLTGPAYPTISDSFYVDLNVKYAK